MAAWVVTECVVVCCLELDFLELAARYLLSALFDNHRVSRERHQGYMFLVVISMS